MSKENDQSYARISDLERSLQEATREASHYKKIAEAAGVARLRETEALSHILTERIQIEAELEHHRDHLEELVGRRTTELFGAMQEAQQLNAQLQQEIHERGRVEEATRESEARFKLLAHNSPDTIMRFDRECRHLYVNPVVEKTTGIPPQVFIGKTHSELGFPCDLNSIWEEAIHIVFESQREHRVEFQLPNGVWIDWLLFPEFGPNCEVTAVFTTARDISAYKEIEETLRLEIAERQRTEEKQRKLELQLRQTQKMEALGRLAGGIAHDFNNILAIMLGQVEFLLLSLPEENPTRTSLDTVLQAGDRAADLIRQILLFSRHQEHLMESTDLAKVVEETLSLMRATIPTSIDIRAHIESHCCPILADGSQIQQVIVNLCVNAKDAMVEDGGTLAVSLVESRIDDEEAQALDLIPGTYARLTISDTGQGMPTAVQEQIFEPFFTTKKVGEGSGLGLAVVHGIVTTHQGAISVESNVGHGSTFSLFFPVVEETIALVPPTGDYGDAGNGHGHILVVDDEVGLASLYESALMRSGYQVTACIDGNQALSAFRTNPNGFDLVFTDQVMPGLTGIQLSQEILKIRADIPIILATGYSEFISEITITQYGVRDLLMKPVRLQTLISAICNILVQEADSRTVDVYSIQQ